MGTGDATRLGNDGGEALCVLDKPDDLPVNIEDVIARFRDETKLLFREGVNTPYDYASAWRRFAANVGLKELSRKQLTPARARKLLMDHIATLSPKSRRWALNALKSVWIHGLRLPWPLDIRRDFGRSLPRVERRGVPNDEEVRPFALALEQEPHPYFRAWVRTILSYGFRPADQLGALRWKNIRYDEAGRPHAFVAGGIAEGFKTGSPIVAYIPPALAKDLLEWKAASPNTSPDAPIFPRMGKAEVIHDPMRMHTTDSEVRLWRAFKKRHSIESALTSVHMRHWVKRRGRKRLDLAILAYWQGHDARSESGGMSGVYGTNIDETEILEEQSREWPDGPLGDLVPVRVKEDSELPSEVVRAVLAYMKGEKGDLELAMELGRLRQKSVRSDLLRT